MRYGYVVKLVRDRIAERVGEDRSFHYEPVSNREQHAKLLLAKLLEEVGEYMVATDSAEKAAELADVLDICRALAWVDVHGAAAMMTPEQAWKVIEVLSREKTKERGGFERGTLMVATDDGAVGDTRPEWERR